MFTAARKLAVGCVTLLATLTFTAPAAARQHHTADDHTATRGRAAHRAAIHARKRPAAQVPEHELAGSRRYAGLDVTDPPRSPNAPYMGLDTWYGSAGDISQSVLVDYVNEALADGLSRAGYRIVWLDAGWWQGQRDTQGDILVNPSQWPNGMGRIAAYIHSKGLLAGIYTDGGLDGCGGAGQGSYGHYEQDVNTFAAWGFDAVKVDNCGGTGMGADPRVLYGQFAQAIANDSPHRSMILNVCNPLEPGQWGGTLPTYQNSAFDNWSWAPAVATSWRVSYDIGHPGNVQFSGVLHNFEQAAAHPQAAGHGHFNDPDYLVPDQGMSQTEAQAQLSMWAELAAPLMLSTNLTTISPRTLAMVENPEAIAIDQDRAGVQGRQVSHEGVLSVWVKPLADGQKAVMFLNPSGRTRTESVAAPQIGPPGARTLAVRDVWAHRTTVQGGSVVETVPAHGVVLLRVERG